MPFPVPVFLEAVSDTRNLTGSLSSRLRRRTWERMSADERKQLVASLDRLDWLIRDFLDATQSGRWLSDGAPQPRDRSKAIPVEYRAVAYVEVMP